MKNNNFWDSQGIVHNQEVLSQRLTGTAWTDIPLSSGWSNIAVGVLNKLQYKKKGNEIILRGCIQYSTNFPSNSTFATLPAEARPILRNIVQVSAGGTFSQRIDIYPDGTMKTPFDVAASTSLFFDGISFFID